MIKKSEKKNRAIHTKKFGYRRYTSSCNIDSVDYQFLSWDQKNDEIINYYYNYEFAMLLQKCIRK